MKSPFKKLRDFALSKHGSKEKASASSWELAEESRHVTNGMQDVENMQSQYEGLLTNAHAISGAAYDFSRSLQEMASFMVETFGQIGDGEIGNIFSMLGKVQFEISKLLDLYAAHVSQTIIIPTESILNELQQVEVMKGQYDEKRQLYNHIQREKLKGKPKNGKGDLLNPHLVSAKEDFDEQASVLSFRLQSLKQGRSLSLVTQAARYHTAQMHLFSKGLASIHAVEPVMRQISLERNIDRTLFEGDVDVHGNMNDMEMDGDALENGEESESLASSPRFVQETQIHRARESEGTGKIPEKWEGSSKSAPISPSLYFQNDGIENIQEISLDKAVRKTVTTYALPCPSGTSGRWDGQAAGLGSLQSHASTQGFSSHEVSTKTESLLRERSEGYRSGMGGQYISNGSHEVKRTLFLGEHGTEVTRGHLPLYSAENNMQVPKQNANPLKEAASNGRLITFSELTNNGDLNGLPKASQRYSHSGPLMAPWTSNKHATVNGGSGISVFSHQIDPLFKSGPVSRSPMPSSFTSPIISQIVSPPLLSPPRISELHKLPPPPAVLSTPPKSASLIAHSAPLGRKSQDPSLTSGPASPLPPPPPGLVTRSLSIPSSAKHAQTLQQGEATDSQASQTMEGGLSSPPLKPIILPVTTSTLHAPADGSILQKANQITGVH